MPQVTFTDSQFRNELGNLPSSPIGDQVGDSFVPVPQSPPEAPTTIVDEAQECLAQSLLMFLYADMRLLSATGRINTKFETLCIDSDRVPRTTAAELAQLEGLQLPRGIASMNNSCEGVTPGQVMAILFVELRQEVLAQRKRVKEQMKRDKAAGWLGNAEDSGSEEESESDDDLDAGVMNKITDRKGRKEFETDMHALIRSYNNMLATDLKGIPEVKIEKMFTNPLRRASNMNLGGRKQRPWLRPGQLTQRLFSFDDFDQGGTTGAGGDHSRHNNDSDDEESKASKSSATGKMRAAARRVMHTGALLRKSTPREPPPTDQVELVEPSEGRNTGDSSDLAASCSGSGVRSSKASCRPKLSLIEESKSERDSVSERDSESKDEQSAQVSESEKGLDGEQELDAQKSRGQSVTGEMPKSKLSEIIESVRGMRASAPPRDCDLHSLRSDPGPNQSWYGESPDLSGGLSSNTRPPLHRRKSTIKSQLTQLTDYVERYREDHALHNKLIIPTDDYETFAGAEDVGNKLVKMTNSMNLSMMSALPELAESISADPGRNMSENELLDFMTKCIESRNHESLDFMADFFRDNTVSQTMVKSKAQVVWLQDWFPIKDCIYAISVDKEKKRVLVVFRGATTRADWSHGFDAAMKRGHNPVKDTYEGKKSYLKIHRGFYTYLFRTRKDTSTRKYDEIASKVYEYGNKLIGSDFTVTVNGYSLGGALSVLFGFYASTDDRFTRNGPVKIFSYGMPLAASHTFADAFRHQEMKRKVQHARFYNSNDLVAHMPFNAKPTKRGSNFVHVGIDVKLYSVPGNSFSLRGSRYPRFHYNERQSSIAAYWRAIKMNSLINMPLPWKIKGTHGLQELQKRIARAILVAETETTKNSFLRTTLDEAYEAMVYKKEE